MNGRLMGEIAHVIDEFLRGREHTLERRAALGQVIHAAHGLVPQRDFAGMALNLIELVGGNLGVLGQGCAGAGLCTLFASSRGTAKANICAAVVKVSNVAGRALQLVR